MYAFWSVVTVTLKSNTKVAPLAKSNRFEAMFRSLVPTQTAIMVLSCTRRCLL